ncbi:uroporphyrinogen decarboxylase [candidate division KSB1 bacterium]|nr:uroporphyrinogen decarboxylase [candidate division KSB1 bacterium]
MSPNLKNDLFLRACQKQPVSRTPIWVMRQAGRYLPAYQAVRAKVDFQELYKTPALAAEVTAQPVEILSFDAAILFSDILVIPEAMGMKLEFSEGKGPRFPQPLRGADDIGRLHHPKIEVELDFVLEAIRLTRQRLAGAVPLIGFCGSPWTLATYMVEGGGSKEFANIKSLMFGQPQLLHSLLENVTAALVDYLNAQIRAGVHAVQIFDSWGYVLAPDDYEEFSLRYTSRLIAGLKRNGVPVIYFLRGRGCGLKKLAASGADVLSLDWTIDLAEARQQIEDRVALQGNLDPIALLATPEVARAQTKKILAKMVGASGHIFNLGHGILPNTPVENVQAVISAVKE